MMVAQNPSYKEQHVYRMDAVTFCKLKAVIDHNNKMLKELREEEERKDQLIRKLTAERFRLQYLHQRSAENGQDNFGNPHEM
ncbi:Glutamyl-tRNA reductase [Frankliniella fusca]|uniref:Glutamyl-tRNA reductase n=1 Tax=Frankliniella fusca TaxID=407009 RepID=A0AAE1LF14_9NEOP|nr:Glutamyl-tRNA reductase [Frankliniella fusca]